MSRPGDAERVGVMQLIDTLDAGGAERVAVNLANLLPRERYRSYLCTTRRDGALADLVEPDVIRLCLNRRSRGDLGAIRRLAGFLCANDIRILQAHSTSLFVARAAALASPRTAILWHDHYGAGQVRPTWLYGPAAWKIAGVIAVNEALARWSRERLCVPANRVHYVPNFIDFELDGGATAPDLPGSRGARIVCVANLRPLKDHPTLLAAMGNVAGQAPAAHLILVGDGNPEYRESLRRKAEERGLSDRVTLLGQRPDVPAILRGCDVGVLASRAEGLPLALLEYGMAGLPTVATRVGQCPDVLDNGQAGLLVEPGDPHSLAEALLTLLGSPAQRAELGTRLRQRVQQHHDARAILGQIGAIYDQVLASRGADRTAISSPQ